MNDDVMVDRRRSVLLAYYPCALAKNMLGLTRELTQTQRQTEPRENNTTTLSEMRLILSRQKHHLTAIIQNQSEE